MKVYRNVKEIRRKDTIGRRFTLAGMGVLAVGFVASLVPTWYPPDAPIQGGIVGFIQLYWSWISFGALFVGFLCASIGSYYINRYARRRWPGSRFVERPDQVLERNLKGLDDKFAFFSQSLPGANYLLAGANGITVFALRSDKGKVIVDGSRWKEPFSITRFFTFFAREGVGAPDQELEDQKNKLRALLAQQPGLAEVPMDSAAVFLNPLVQLEINNPAIPVLRPEQVKDHVRARVKEARVPNATQKALVEFLAGQGVWQEE
jgi:MFS family permease